MKQISLPQRRKLPHDIPSWVVEGAHHFITINCRQRGVNTLCHRNIATALFAEARRCEDAGHWYLWLMLLMPDHIHLIATFDLLRGIRKTIAQWKRFQATHYGIQWQPNFFEHRLRNQDEFDEKTHYIRMNAVRQELILTAEDWPYVMDRNNIQDAVDGVLGEPALPKMETGVLGEPALPTGGDEK